MISKILRIKHVSIGEGIPKIIIPLVGQTRDRIMQELASALDLQPDAIEWRLDAFQNSNDFAAVQEMMALLHERLADKLLIVTFRSKDEGGEKEISKADYVALNKWIIHTNQADFIDVEWSAGEKIVQELVASAKANAVRVIMSSHDFNGTPDKSELVARLRQMQTYGADIPKIAVMPRCQADVLTLLEATEEMNRKYADRPMITMAMGGLGAISRLCGEVFGSAMTFGVGQTASAPGQIPVKELRQALAVIHDRL
ncbi:type I 3-dehydroquinate dehydratase [Sporolactobacillus spathodeae]|uniref:3-dehydroquinate dehydratase n=1 Tax=Sporolactobacillus spathodeae TaxID=1465502 RepID=A0ABS2Q8B1_9BACL|nr:type I 3-dehydroquinate dehydratase [Sporolactobacillus spathodeae]MBM7657675.1 3-dehydroquinate dehydratase-1 [Sporolactobacillus spathodeae]